MADPDGVPFLDLRAAARESRAELLEAAARTIDSGRWVGGEEVSRFEAAWASFCETGHCVGTGNGLDALTLALRALGIGPGDEVVVPSFTFIATWLAVSAAGATPVPVEIDPRTANLDARLVGERLSERTRAIVPVHLYGQPADMDAVMALADAAGAAVLEDAAQAHGARWRGRRAGSIGTAAAFSFYPAKNLGCLGDGGAVVCADPELAERVRMLGNYGARRKYEHEFAGVNSRLDALQAALLMARLERLEAGNARRAAIAACYGEQLSELPWLELPWVVDGAQPVWHLYVVRCARRDALRRHLDASGIETGLHYPQAPHRSGAYSHLGLRFPVAELLAATSLSLPIGPHLSPAQADRVIAAVRAFSPSRGTGH